MNEIYQSEVPTAQSQPMEESKIERKHQKRKIERATQVKKETLTLLLKPAVNNIVP